jgi:hypothetical protein
MPDAAPLDTGCVHHAFVDPLLRQGRAPTRGQVAAALRVGVAQVDAALAALEATHGVVLDPHSGEPWVLHPFSRTPTATWVTDGRRGWWAPCLWCAFGIVGLIGGDAAIHTRLGGEAEPITIHVTNGDVIEDDLRVHFALPPRDAWNNVHSFCSMVLPFRSEAEVDRWSARHALPRGEAIPIRQAWELGRHWYARHADPDWQKWTGAQAAAIFEAVGLTGPFWRFEPTNDPF